MHSLKPVDVAIGILINEQQQFFITKRGVDLTHPGLWEFPGGKVESNESSYQAVCRELHEECAVEVDKAKLLVQLWHHYRQQPLLLHVFLIQEYRGEPQSCLQQVFAWVGIDDIGQYDFPEANDTIVDVLRLSLEDGSLLVESIEDNT